VKAAGLIPRNCGNGHWRIEGGLTEVNWYPFSKQKTIYLNSTTSKATMKDGTIERAIKAANDPGVLPMVGDGKVNRANLKNWRQSMMKVNPCCHWCGSELNEQIATADHVIPIARGGTNHHKNLVLACRPCNQKRGHC
jgi:5-methylcytosine-specific restriction endonuclease McrA